MKESGVVFSSPAPPVRKSPLKSQVQQVNPTLPAAPGAEVPVSSSDAVENGNNQEGEGLQLDYHFLSSVSIIVCITTKAWLFFPWDLCLSLSFFVV